MVVPDEESTSYVDKDTLERIGCSNIMCNIDGGEEFNTADKGTWDMLILDRYVSKQIYNSTFADFDYYFCIQISQIVEQFYLA